MGTFMWDREPSLLGIGDNTVDVYVDKGWMFPGGNSVNVAAMAAKLGVSAGYVGCLSRDQYGSLIYDALKEEGVDLSHCRRAEGANACALIGHDQGDRRFLGSRPGVREDFTLMDDDYLYMRSFDIVHTSIFSGLDDRIETLAENATMLSYDFSNRWTDTHRDHLADKIDIAFLSLSELALDECEGVLKSWAQAGCRTVVGTRGSEGSLALHEGRLCSFGVKPARVVDTLGAGDGFVAGFLVEWSKSSDLTRALEAGAVNAAAACAVMGGFGHGRPFSVLPDDLPPRRAAART
ncbi:MULTISPECIES: PfkB family carbohydrate kinase [Rhizobium/Agrobacterium group]|nr:MULTISPECIES: PfkB family carbohydrate kinase [Rhizobium/Agrobacterium group]EUB99979.1 PfkB domain protein [Rhizobium sp. CF080]